MAVVDIYNTDRRYATMLGDPAWPYNDKLAGESMRGGLSYQTMTVDEIAALPIERLALPDCELWLWTTNSHIHDALHIVEAWGFTYRSKRTWVKQGGRPGIGFWLRGQTEDLLVASRGRPRGRMQMRKYERRKTPLLSSLLTARRTKHSRKPREAYEDIERVGGTPRLELFARRARPGWDSWGYEAKELDLELGDDLDEHIRRAR